MFEFYLRECIRSSSPPHCKSTMRNFLFAGIQIVGSVKIEIGAVDTQTHAQMVAASGNAIAWGHPTRKAVGTL